MEATSGEYGAVTDNANTYYHNCYSDASAVTDNANRSQEKTALLR